MSQNNNMHIERAGPHKSHCSCRYEADRLRIEVERLQPLDDLAQHVAWLEQLLKPGYSLTRTHSGVWYLKCWDSYMLGNAGIPRLGWRFVDSDRSLEVLLARLGEP